MMNRGRLVMCQRLCCCCCWHEAEEGRDACWVGFSCVDISEREMESGTREPGWKT